MLRLLKAIFLGYNGFMSLIIKWKRAKPGESVGFLLWRVHNLWQQQMKVVLKPFGLTHVQYVLLAGVDWMGEHGLEVSQAKLAEFVGTDVMMTSTVVRTLMEKGFLRRRKSESDGRALLLEMTDEGREVVQEAERAVEGFDGGFFSVLGEGLVSFRDKLGRLFDGVFERI